MPYEIYPWQEECLEIWFSHKGRGCISAMTGSGKTVLAMFAILRLQQTCSRPLHVKVIVPTVAVMNQWERTFRTFLSGQCPDTYDRADIGCWYGECKPASRHKYTIYVVNSARGCLAGHIRSDWKQGFDVLLIADEYHHYFSSENRKIFQFLPLADTDREHFFSMGLSATPDFSAADGMITDALGPEIYRYGFSRALEHRTVCKFSILQIALSFSAEELDFYMDMTEKMGFLMTKLRKEYPFLKKMEMKDLFSTLKKLADDSVEEAGAYLELSWRRKAFVCSAGARTSCLLTLLRQFAPADRILIFCERIEQAEEVYRCLKDACFGRPGRYHSGLGREQNRDTLRAFRDGEIRILISCRALDEGVDVPDANIAVVLSGTSVQRQRIQRLGRILRTAEGKESAVLYYLYVRESAEERSYFTDAESDMPVCSLYFDAADCSFTHIKYENASLKVLHEIAEKTDDPEILAEVRRCLMEGIARPDWLATARYCDRQIAAARSVHEKNYWICMKKLQS